MGAGIIIILAIAFIMYIFDLYGVYILLIAISIISYKAVKGIRKKAKAKIEKIEYEREQEKLRLQTEREQQKLAEQRAKQLTLQRQKQDLHDTAARTMKYDDMNGQQFEEFCAYILKLNNFHNIELTKSSGDDGVDILGHKDGILYAIQCKCYAKNIGNDAIQQVFTGKSIYQANVGIVLTNREFTRSAIDTAKKTGIVLWDRSKLNELILNATEYHRKNII